MSIIIACAIELLKWQFPLALKRFSHMHERYKLWLRLLTVPTAHYMPSAHAYN